MLLELDQQNYLHLADSVLGTLHVINGIFLTCNGAKITSVDLLGLV